VSSSRFLLRSLSLLALAALAACGGPPKTGGAEPGMRLLTEPQYRRIIADVFGEQIVVGGAFDPLVRTNGLLTVGASGAHVTPAGLEQLDRVARSVAAQVTAEENRDFLIPCTPRDARAADDECAAKFFRETGRLLYRRPLVDDEVRAATAVAARAARELGSFHDGLAAGLAGMLVSPNFLFVIEHTEPDPDRTGAVRLDAWSKATRLSLFLWGSAPDDELLQAAASGELHSASGLKKQVDRMLDSPRLEQGLRLFFDDMLSFENIGRLEKDSIIYPAFSAAVANDAREQTLRTLIDVVLVQEADYRDVFTTRKTFISGALGRIYRVPVTRPDGGWMEYEFPADDPRSGIATHVSFTALHSHAGRSSPTLRGKALREILLCQRVPDPPGTVDFSKFNDPTSPAHTARERLTVHSVNPACAGCHKLTDPVGLGMEHIDGAGQLRTAEDGHPIDASGSLDGIAFADVAGIGPALRENPAAPACLVNRLYSYATARVPARNERRFLHHLEQQFADDDYRVPALLRKISLSEAMYAVKPPAAEKPPAVRTAANIEGLRAKS
jgi:hypothetical protein